MTKTKKKTTNQMPMGQMPMSHMSMGTADHQAAMNHQKAQADAMRKNSGGKY